MPGTSLSPDLQDLIRRVAAYPHGLGFLHQSDLDIVAVTLGVHPYVVAEARRLLETAEGRDALIAEVRSARLATGGPPEGESGPLAPQQPGSAAGTGPATESAHGAAGAGAPPADARGLIEAAELHPLGVPFLRNAPFETVAVTFRVHPFLVLQARELLASEGHGRNPDPGSGI